MISYQSVKNGSPGPHGLAFCIPGGLLSHKYSNGGWILQYFGQLIGFQDFG